MFFEEDIMMEEAMKNAQSRMSRGPSNAK